MIPKRVNLACAWLILIGCMITIPAAQGQTTSAASDEDDGGFAVRDGDVGYIDSAILGNQMRLRYDAANDFGRPNRAEFFYARAQPVGPGLPRAEVAVDYQQWSLYTEYQTHDLVSLFVELGIVALNPIINGNTAGMGDMNVGCKLCLLETSDFLATAQLRVYAPTGDVERGLGNGHASIEPGLLLLHRLDRRWTTLSEFRYWTALGGSDFAGDLIRYGIGLQYQPDCSYMPEPVVELVGWTVLSGQQSVLDSPGGVERIENASGDTIINAKAGARVPLTCDSDVYVGYGRALTGDKWYQDTFRAELRYAF